MFQPRPNQPRRRFWSIMAVGVPWVLGVTVLVAVERVQSDGWLTRSLLDLWSETSASFNPHGLAEAPAPPHYFALKPAVPSSPAPLVWHSEYGIDVPSYPTSPASAAPESVAAARAAAYAEQAVAMVDAESLEKRLRRAHSYRPHRIEDREAAASRDRAVQLQIERAVADVPVHLDELRERGTKVNLRPGNRSGSSITAPLPGCSKNTISIDG